MKATATLLALLPCLALAGEPTSYDLMFRTGTLDAVPHDMTLVYARTVTEADTAMADRATGEVRLAFDGEAAVLAFRRGASEESIGSFPAATGNPLAMFFAETLVSDMARIAGGSPFYIRNRIKDALATPAEVRQATVIWEGREVPATTVTLHPFEGDPNRARMAGFDALTITATLSDAVPGWYYALSAEAGTIYASSLRLEDRE